MRKTKRHERSALVRKRAKYERRIKQEALALMFLDDVRPNWDGYEVNGIDVTNAIHRLVHRGIIEDTHLGRYFMIRKDK